MDTLLIVDDNIELLCLYKALLAICGRYDVAGTAGNGRDAINEYIKLEKKPDLVLMDVNMPEVDGISAAREIQRLDNRAKIMFVTAERINSSDLPPELSYAPILRKPFSKEEFIGAIRSALSGSCGSALG